jgi:DNA mismatch repair ATPase MutS
MNTVYREALIKIHRKAIFELKQSKKRSFVTAMFRLMLFASLLLTIYFFFQHKNPFWLVGTIVLIALFLVLVRFNAWLAFQLKSADKKRSLLEAEIAYTHGEFSALEKGEAYRNTDHPFAIDLDLFGENSLFQRINRSGHPLTKDLLALWLQKPLMGIEEIESRQLIFKELAAKIDFRLACRSHLNDAFQEQGESFQLWLRSLPFFKKKSKFYIKYPLALLSIVGLSLSLYVGVLHPVLWLAIPLNLIALGLISRKVSAYQHALSLSSNHLDSLTAFLESVKKESFQNPSLVRFQEQVVSNRKSLRQLEKGVASLDQRLNDLVGLLLNLFFVYDYWVIESLENWREKEAQNCLALLEACTLFEVWENMANFCFHHHNFEYPSLDAQRYFQVEEMYHPFIPEDKAVKNNFKVSPEDELFLVTGANMAGKSTFLRAVGINWLLGMIGLPLGGSKALIGPVVLMTSMRINDSLAEGSSYFKAEVERLSELMRIVQLDKRSFVLMDEILRGTNSNDKRLGTIGFCEKLIKMYAKGVLATHDLEVATHFEGRPGVKNINFESRLEQGELVFDYKLREGIAINTNASILMRLKGIID